MKHDFLVEIGTEELPPKSLLTLSTAFTDGVVAGLTAAGLRHGKVESFAAPRRLAVLVRRLDDVQAAQAVKRKGPPVSAAFGADGSPSRAATAFAESCGTTIDALARISEAKGEFLYYTGIKEGAPTRSLLHGIVSESLQKLPIAKRMRWGSGSAEFVRPVHWVVMLFGDEIIPGRLFDIEAGRHTRGHRFMAPKAISLKTPASYEKRLTTAGKVIASFATRREKIRAGVAALADEHGLTAVMSAALLDEVTGLVEWPAPVAGRFEERFLELPAEVLIATLQDHQRYFPVREPGGELSSLFITVANIESRAVNEIRAGNERVVRPRLADAAFFFESDRKRSLASRCDDLKKVTFQAELGSYFQKSERIKALSLLIAAATKADQQQCGRAAQLAKTDLLTGLVGEFPELQGTMGSYYARLDGEAADVASAISEHYLPRFAGDQLPVSQVGTVLALADKLDTICGIFSIGQKPSGTRDPFGLRRAALGFLRIVLENHLELDLPALIHSAVELNLHDAVTLKAPDKVALAASDVAVDVYDYILERLRGHVLESNDVTIEMFDAVLDRRPRSLLDFVARLHALREFLTQADAPALASANKRIANILRKNPEPLSTMRADLFVQDEERELGERLRVLIPTVSDKLGARAYTTALKELAQLRPAVDAFFDKVMVMHEDAAIRANRLALLATLRELFLGVADLSRLPG